MMLHTSSRSSSGPLASTQTYHRVQPNRRSPAASHITLTSLLYLVAFDSRYYIYHVYSLAYCVVNSCISQRHLLWRPSHELPLK